MVQIRAFVTKLCGENPSNLEQKKVPGRTKLVSPNNLRQSREAGAKPSGLKTQKRRGFKKTQNVGI